MKKVLFSLLAVAGMLFAGNTVKAQQAIKIGVFDLDRMVQAMPGYRSVDSLLQIYQQDSLAAEYDFYQSEYKRLDSTYKADSTNSKAKTVLEMEKQQRQQVALNLVYWQQISQNKVEQKRQQLASPIYEKVVNSYKKILEQHKYTLILKPDALEVGSTGVEDIFTLVAKDLKLPVQGGAADQGAAEQAPAEKKPAAPAKKPGAKG